MEPDKPGGLHISSETGWRGGERQVVLLMQGLASRGWTQTLAAPRKSALGNAAAQAGFPVLWLRASAFCDPIGLIRLVRHLKSHPGTIVHAHTSRAFDSARLLRSMASLGALIVTRRVSFPIRSAAKYRTAADRYVAISSAIAQQLREVGTPTDRIAKIPSGVDFDELDRTRAVPEHSSPGSLVGCVAQMTEEKGVCVLAQAWMDVVKAIPDASLVLIGDGPERPLVERLFAQAGLTQKVHFAGFCQASEVVLWLKRLDCYVQPSLQEGLGSSAIDALALGIPTVASRVGGLPEVVLDGQGGLLVPPGDADALAAAIIRLLKDPELARRLGDCGRTHVRETFSVTRMVERYDGLYRELAMGS